MRRLSTLAPLTVVLALGVLPLAALAQATPPRIVVPQPSSKAAPPKTLGGKGLATGKLLTRDELRQCMKRLDDINAQSKPLESNRVALDAERAELTKAGDALKTEREDIDRKLASVREWETRVRAHGAAIEAYNKKSATLADAPRDQKDALQNELTAEAARINTNRDALAADEARVVPAYQNAVKAYNAKAEARDAKVGEWNTRNAAANEASKMHDDARLAWLDECANRPYREDDEIAIKKEKK